MSIPDQFPRRFSRAVPATASRRFQDGAAGMGRPPRLLPDGRVTVAGQSRD